MKDKILNDIYEKMCNYFGKKNLTPNEIEKKFPAIANTVLNSFSTWEKAYQQLKTEQDKSIVKINKDEYIIEKLKGSLSYLRGQMWGSNEYEITIKNLKKIKHDYKNEYEQYLDQYNKDLEEEDKNIVIPFSDFVRPQIDKYLSDGIKNEKTGEYLDLETKFWDFISDEICYDPTILDNRDNRLKTLEKLTIKFKQSIYSIAEDELMKLLPICEKYLSDIQFLGSESCFVNFGYRRFEHEKSGWIKNNFNVFNNGIHYSFSFSSKNEKEIEGYFVNIFILDTKKKRLQKIAITLNEVEQTTFIIWKEFEKISIKNECEIYIEKHYGNETIIFDSRKEALEFYETIIDIKEGRKNKY